MKFKCWVEKLVTKAAGNIVAGNSMLYILLSFSGPIAEFLDLWEIIRL